MAIKIIQDTPIPRLTPSVGVAVTSSPIALKSGYLRVTIGSTTGSSGGYIAIGNEPVATANHFHITSYSVDIVKERMARQRVAGITTGSSTVVLFGENNGNPFVVGDCVTIENASTAGINTTHKSVIASTDSSITIDFDSSSIVSPNIFGAIVSRSVKVSCLTYEPDTFFNIAEVVQLVSE